MDNARELAADLLRLLRREQGAMADFLADFDDRRLWLKLGHSSLFTFLHRELGLSKGASHFRKTAAALIQRYPEVVEPLRDGRLCITSIVELAKVITPESRVDVLPRFFHTSKQEAKAVAVEICPQESVPKREVVTAVAMACARPLLPTATRSPVRQDVAEVRLGELALAPAPPATPAPRTVAEPLTAELRRLHVTVSTRFLEKLDAARDALSHSHPGADAEAILEAGLDLVIERTAKRKGLVAKPRTPPPQPGSAFRRGPLPQRLGGEGKNPSVIPAAVKREVWIRDGGRCQRPLEGGGICGSTHRLQFDHVVPRARGGKANVANLRLLCQPCNLLAARQLFGDAWMDRFMEGGRRARGEAKEFRPTRQTPP